MAPSASLGFRMPKARLEPQKASNGRASMDSSHGSFASTEQDLCRTRSKVGSSIGQLARNERAQTVANQQQVRCRFDSEKYLRRKRNIRTKRGSANSFFALTATLQRTMTVVSPSANTRSESGVVKSLVSGAATVNVEPGGITTFDQSIPVSCRRRLRCKQRIRARSPSRTGGGSAQVLGVLSEPHPGK